MAKLVVLSEGLKGRSYELKVDTTTVGRVEDNTFQLAEPSVSSHHCEISLRGKDIVVKDLNSTNGTYVNGERITEAPLKPGQVLRLGQIELRLENGEGEAVPSTKKSLEQTRVMQGVKANDFEGATRQVTFDKNSPFARKSNKPAVVFITIAIVLLAIIVVLIFFAISQMK